MGVSHVAGRLALSKHSRQRLARARRMIIDAGRWLVAGAVVHDDLQHLRVQLLILGPAPV